MYTHVHSRTLTYTYVHSRTLTYSHVHFAHFNTEISQKMSQMNNRVHICVRDYTPRCDQVITSLTINCDLHTPRDLWGHGIVCLALVHCFAISRHIANQKDFTVIISSDHFSFCREVHDKGSLQGVITRGHYKGSLQGGVIRGVSHEGNYKVTLRGVYDYLTDSPLNYEN